MNLLTEPLAYEFFRQGLAASVLVGTLCGLIGVYVVLRRMSYIGHGLSHAVFGGAVVAYVASIDFYLGAGAWGFMSALLINAIARSRRVGADAAIGIVTTASFAVGVALISQTRSFTRNFEAALFGNILGVTPADLVVISGVAVSVAAVHRPVLQAPPVHDLRPGGGAHLRRPQPAHRHPLLTGTGRDHRGLDQHRRRHADRRDAHHPGQHGSSAHRFVQPDARCCRRRSVPPQEHWACT